MTQPAGESSSTALPIVIAFGIAAVVLIAVVAVRAGRGDEVRAEAGVGRAVVGQNDALQRGDYPGFRRFTCAAQQRTEAAVLGEQEGSRQAKGARFVDDVTGLTVDGETASAEVTYHFEKSPDGKVTTRMSFVRETDGWKVCSAGPR